MAKTPVEIADEFAVPLYAAAHRTVASEVEPDDLGLAALRALLIAVLETSQNAVALDQNPKGRLIIFTGPFEEAFSYREAEERLEELLDSGHNQPTIVNALLDGTGEITALSAHKVINVQEPGEIR